MSVRPVALGLVRRRDAGRARSGSARSLGLGRRGARVLPGAWATLGLAGALALTACGDDGPSSPARGRTIEVEVFDFGYRPVAVSARVGDRIRWTQTGDIQHTVTSGEPGTPGSGQSFDEVVEEPGDVVEVTVSSPGAIPYFCRPHPFMAGSI